MPLTTKTIPASSLSTDSDVAQWLFDTLAVDEQSDPLDILMQREAEGEFTFHTEDGVQYPYFEHARN